MLARRLALGTVRKLRSSQEKWAPRKGPPWGSRVPGRSAVCLCIALRSAPLPSPLPSPPPSLHSSSSAGRGLFSAPAAMETQATDPRLSSSHHLSIERAGLGSSRRFLSSAFPPRTGLLREGGGLGPGGFIWLQRGESGSGGQCPAREEVSGTIILNTSCHK